MGSVGANLVMLQKQVGWGNCARGLGGKRTITAGDAIVPTIGSSDYHSQSLPQSYCPDDGFNRLMIVQKMILKLSSPPKKSHTAPDCASSGGPFLRCLFL